MCYVLFTQGSVTECRGERQEAPHFRSPLGMGDYVTEEALTSGILGVFARSVSKRRWVRLVMETGYDAIVWIGGLLVAARAAGTLTDADMTRLEFGTERRQSACWWPAAVSPRGFTAAGTCEEAVMRWRRWCWHAS